MTFSSDHDDNSRFFRPSSSVSSILWAFASSRSISIIMMLPWTPLLLLLVACGYLTHDVTAFSMKAATSTTPSTTTLSIPAAKSLTRTTLATSTSYNQLALSKMPQFPRTWVPLASVYELNGQRPNRVEFLGQNYVAYYQTEKDSWTVVDDACPHRLAPLSEGRIIVADDDANEIKQKDLTNLPSGSTTKTLLECAYHGWAFQHDGTCARIPQATAELQARTIQSNTNCHVHSYSTRVAKNILFCWPWPEDVLEYTDMTNNDNNNKASQQHAWRQPEFMLRNLGNDTTTYTRDLPYGWDTLLENIVDPAHVPWAHHGMQGSRQDAIAINMTTPTKLQEGGFKFSYQDRTIGMHREGVGEFRAPFVIDYHGIFYKPAKQDGNATTSNFNLTATMTPTKPGWSRIIIHSGSGARGIQEQQEHAMNAMVNRTKRSETTSAAADATAVSNKKNKKKPGKRSVLTIVFSLMPTWLLHQFSNRFLDSDLAFLHYQERERMCKRGVDADGYCMPAPADRCISAMRRWIQEFAHIPTTATVLGKANNDTERSLLLPASPNDKSALFDRWSQHSDHCKYCHGALDGVKKWRRNTLAVMGASVLLATKFLAARLSVVACLAVLRLLVMAEHSLKKGGFDHYRNA